MMMRSTRRRGALPRGRARAGRGLRVFAALFVTLALAFLAWPYHTLWRLDRALVSDDSAALEALVDLDAVRGEIKKKLNKDADSAIGDLSDPFIRWLEAGIQTAGSDALDRLVTPDWVRERLLSAGDHRGLLQGISYAFFDAPNGFRVTAGPERGEQVHARLTLDDFAWRVTALYY